MMETPFSYPYGYIAGTGGIGTGRLFMLEGDHVLGRCESRKGSLTDYKDYCKLHITMHYISVFLRGEIPVYAIGQTGKDQEGRTLKAEMANAGINVEYVAEDRCRPTMYSVCGQYPNGEGFNITANNSASHAVKAEDIDRFFKEKTPKGTGIIIAVPEVPLETRIHLLKKGREKLCFNIAGVQSVEAADFVKQGGAVLADLIALNTDEAGAFASLRSGENSSLQDILNNCESYLLSLNPDLTVIITLGGEGAQIRYRGHLYSRKAVNVPLVNTAGAGDCLLGTFIAAAARGIDPFVSLDIAVAASGKKTSCKDTIDFSMNPENLLEFARSRNIVFPDNIIKDFFFRAVNYPVLQGINSL